MIKLCCICNKEFNVKPSRIKRGWGKCCSLKCNGEWRSQKYRGEKCYQWKGGKTVKRKCLSCDTSFMLFPSWAYRKNRKTGMFCSRKCKAIFYLSKQIKKDTLPERLIEKELLKQGILYSKQVPLLGVAIVDFLLPDKVIIQVDGDYWHSLPKVKKRDANQDFILGFKGYKIYRFWERNIKKSPSACIKHVITKNICQNLG